MSRINDLISFYEQGVITQLELFCQILINVTPETCCYLDSFSESSTFKNYIDKQPKTDEEWNRFMIVSIGTYSRNMTTADWDALMARNKDKHRRGVEIIRAHWSRSEQPL